MWTYKRHTPRATFAILAVAVTIMLGTFIDILATHTPVQSVHAGGTQHQALASFDERQSNTDQTA